MTTGTKSLLFGVHQFIWHPITVARGWHKLHGSWPNWREAICIFIHDWGYWGCQRMDDPQGELHPIIGARIARRWLDGITTPICRDCREGRAMECFIGAPYGQLVLLHSRHLAHRVKRKPSALCWPDKLSLTHDPCWFYILRARLSGELVEYRTNAARFLAPELADREWFYWLRGKLQRVALQELTVSENAKVFGPTEDLPV